MIAAIPPQGGHLNLLVSKWKPGFSSVCVNGGFLLPSWGRLRLPIALMVLFASLGTTGCGPKRVRVDYTHYENSYAVTSNHEELLNLARLDQHDPTYFFKFGQISSSYRMEAGLSGSGQYVSQVARHRQRGPDRGGTPNFIYENDPSFTLIPVNDDTNASFLLKPVDPTVFYSLYLQGWRLDQLYPIDGEPYRAHAAHSDGCKVEVLRNEPPPNSTRRATRSRQRIDARQLYHLPPLSAVIYALQKQGLLLLRGTGTWEP